MCIKPQAQPMIWRDAFTSQDFLSIRIKYTAVGEPLDEDIHVVHDPNRTRVKP
jgi:hypothetical protein